METGAPAREPDRPNPSVPPDDDGAEASLCVSAGGEAVRLPLACVREVLRPPALTRMPHAPASLLGLCNLRGAVLPVFSLRALAGPDGNRDGDRDRFGSNARVVVLATASRRFGLLVDAVLPSGTREGRPIAPDRLLPIGPARSAPLPAPERHDVAPEARRDETGNGAASVALLGFRVGAQEFALRLDAVLSVGRLDAMMNAEPADDASANGPQKIPGTDAAMLGVVAGRDGLLPVLDAAVLLGLRRSPVANNRMVTTRIDGRPVVLAVDALTGILRLPAASIEPVPPLLLRGFRGEARIDGICRPERGSRLVQLLHPDRLLDDATMRRLADAVRGAGEGADASGKNGPAPGAPGEPFLLLRVGQDRYGLPLGAVDEVVRHPGLLPDLPNAPRFVVGVLALRGRVLAVIDAAQRFGAPMAAARDRGRIVVVRHGGTRLGLAVDQASEMRRFAPDAMSSSPGLEHGNALFDRVATTDTGEMVLLLHPATLVAGVERDMPGAPETALAGRSRP